MIKQAIILTSESSYPLAQTIAKEFGGSKIFTKAIIEGTTHIDNINDCVSNVQ